MCADVPSKRRIWQRIPSSSKARFPVPKCTSRAFFPVSGTDEMKSLGLNLPILSSGWGLRGPDSSSYRHMTPAKRTGSLGLSSKLPSERIHSYPAILAMGAHNNVIVATGNIHLVHSWRLLSFSVISKCISLHESNLAVPSVMLLLMTTDNKIHVFVDLIFDIPANDSKMHKRQRKSFHCILSVTLIYLLWRKTEKNSATTTEIRGTSTMYTIRQFATSFPTGQTPYQSHTRGQTACFSWNVHSWVPRTFVKTIIC